MRQVLMCIAMCLLATSISGVPQGHDRPVTNPPSERRRSIDEYFCKVFKMCHKTSQSPHSQPDKTQPDQTQPDQPQPDQPELQVQPDNASEENLSQTCQCVTYYKCRKSSKSKFAISSTGRRVEKCHYLQRCCDEEDIMKAEPTEPSVIDKRNTTL